MFNLKQRPTPSPEALVIAFFAVWGVISMACQIAGFVWRHV